MARVPVNCAGWLRSCATGDRESWLKEFEGLISDDELRELAGPFGEES